MAKSARQFDPQLIVKITVEPQWRLIVAEINAATGALSTSNHQLQGAGVVAELTSGVAVGRG
jgi:hypothetical protein